MSRLDGDHGYPRIWVRLGNAGLDAYGEFDCRTQNDDERIYIRADLVATKDAEIEALMAELARCRDNLSSLVDISKRDRAEIERLKKVADQAIKWSGREMFDPRIHTHDAIVNPELADYLKSKEPK